MWHSLSLLIGVSALVVVNGQANDTRHIVTPFDGISVFGPFSVAISTGSDNTVKIQGNAGVIANIETVVEDGSLHIRFKNPSVLFTGILQMQVSVQKLLNLVAAGPAQINLLMPVDGSPVRIVIAGSASVNGKF